MTELYDFQQTLADDVFNSFKVYRRILLQSSTGSGKTVLGAHVGDKWTGKVRVLAHRKELVLQWQKYFTPDSILTIQQLQHKRYKDKAKWSRNDLLIVDEAHHYADNKWHEALKAWPGYILGLTATPWRASALKGYDHIYQKLIVGPSKQELMTLGALVPALVKNPKFGVIEGRGTGPDGDFSTTATMELFANSVQQYAAMTYEAINWLVEEAPNAKALGFCITVKHAEAVKNYCDSIDLPAMLVTAKTPLSTRLQLFADLQAGKLSLLLTVAVLTEGVDLPECDTVLIMRPTKSLALYLQMVGRAVRPFGEEKLHGTVLDAAGNHARFGHPDDDYLWSLKARRPDLREPRICDVCETVNLPDATFCVGCGVKLTGSGNAWGPRVICGNCGRSRKAVIAECPYCRVTIAGGRVNLASTPESFSHRNAIFELAGYAPIRYEAWLNQIDSTVWVKRLTTVKWTDQVLGGWIGGIQVDEDMVDEYSLHVVMDPDGNVVFNDPTNEQPFKLVDLLLNKAKQMARHGIRSTKTEEAQAEILHRAQNRAKLLVKAIMGLRKSEPKKRVPHPKDLSTVASNHAAGKEALMLLRLTTSTGDRDLVLNTRFIVAINRVEGEHTFVTMDNHTSYRVKESPADIESMYWRNR